MDHFELEFLRVEGQRIHDRSKKLHTDNRIVKVKITVDQLPRCRIGLLVRPFSTCIRAPLAGNDFRIVVLTLAIGAMEANK